MFGIIGQSMRMRQNPVYKGIKLKRTSLEWFTKPYGLTFPSLNVIRVEVRPGDKGTQSDLLNGNERNEFEPLPHEPGSEYFYPLDTDIWLSYSIMVEPGEEIRSNFAIITQGHAKHDSDELSPSPAFCIVLGKGTTSLPITIQTRFDDNRIHVSNPAPVTRWGSTISRGVYHNLVVRRKENFLGKAELQVWWNGIEQINLKDISIGYNNIDQGAGFFGFGIYREGGTNDVLAIRFANIEMGLNSLIDRVSNPLNI